MQERAWLQGGVLTVEAMPGEGTRVEIELPRQEPGTTS